MSLIWNLLHFENSYLFFNNWLQNLQTRPDFSDLFPWLLNGMIPQDQCEKHKPQEYVLCGSLPCLFTPCLTLMT